MDEKTLRITLLLTLPRVPGPSCLGPWTGNQEPRYHRTIDHAPSTYYQSIRQGFRPLVRFIGGKDRDGDKISMTAPVIQSAGDSEDDWVISFSMPSKYDKANLPAPKDSSLYTEDLEPMIAAVIRFSGKANEQMLRDKTKTLLQWLEKASYKVQSKPKYLFYNDPSTPGFLRRNEVMVQVN